MMNRGQFTSNIGECIKAAVLGGLHDSEIVGVLEYAKAMVIAPTISKICAVDKPDETKPKK